MVMKIEPKKAYRANGLDIVTIRLTAAAPAASFIRI